MREELVHTISTVLTEKVASLSLDVTLDENEVVMACLLCSVHLLRAGGHRDFIGAAEFTLLGAQQLVEEINEEKDAK